MARQTRTGSPTEASEQKKLAQWLDVRLEGLWCHVPNGGSRDVREADSLKAQGARRGVPDVLIFAPVTVAGVGYVGTALELKRRPPAVVSLADEQRGWLATLAAAGWYTVVAYGADEAIDLLDELYPERPSAPLAVRICYRCARPSELETCAHCGREVVEVSGHDSMLAHAYAKKRDPEDASVEIFVERKRQERLALGHFARRKAGIEPARKPSKRKVEAEGEATPAPRKGKGWRSYSGPAKRTTGVKSPWVKDGK